MDNQRILIASSNRGKIDEIKALCHDVPIDFISLIDLFPKKITINETGSTFLQNAQIKVDWLWQKYKNWTLADDSGFIVNCLNDEPGVRSARYCGDDCSDQKNMKYLINKLHGVVTLDRSARFCCVMVLKAPSGKQFVVKGECEGTVIEETKGVGGFGYDPIFIPNGYSKTFGELSPEIKNKISHRAMALKELKVLMYELFK